MLKNVEKCLQGKCIINSISLKAGEQDFIEKATTIKVRDKDFCGFKFMNDQFKKKVFQVSIEQSVRISEH